MESSTWNAATPSSESQPCSLFATRYTHTELGLKMKRSEDKVIVTRFTVQSLCCNLSCVLNAFFIT